MWCDRIWWSDYFFLSVWPLVKVWSTRGILVILAFNSWIWLIWHSIGSNQLNFFDFFDLKEQIFIYLFFNFMGSINREQIKWGINRGHLWCTSGWDFRACFHKWPRSRFMIVTLVNLGNMFQESHLSIRMSSWS